MTRRTSFFRALAALWLPLVALAAIWTGIEGIRHWQHERYLRTHWCAIDREVTNVNGDAYIHFHMVTCKEVEESGDAGIESNGELGRQNVNAQEI